MGVVYRAERLKLGRIVAVKVLHESFPEQLASRKRFEIEAMAMAKLEHPHCASVLDVGLHDDTPYVVMDFFVGESLAALIAGGPVPIPRAIEIMRQVLSGLSHAHELGIIHRDIKPANILLTQKSGLGDYVKIVDFGLARLKEGSANLTTGMAIGTPSYMAPEQIRGKTIDHRVDLYSCGVLLFELLTRRVPFHSERDVAIEVVTKHLGCPPPRLDEALPGHDFGALEAVIARALEKSADDRYSSAADFVAALDAIELPGPPVRRLAIGTASDALGTGSIEAIELDPTALETPSDDLAVPEMRRAIRFPRLAIAGLLAVCMLVAIIAGRRDDALLPPVVAAAGPATLDPESSVPAPPIDPAAEVLVRANELTVNGDREAAIALLIKSRRAFPTSASIPYQIGRLYFAKLWWNDGLKSLRDALRIDATYRADPELIKTVLRGYVMTPSYPADIGRFLRDEIGTPAISFLEDIARDHPNPTIRARATAELRRLR